MRIAIVGAGVVGSATGMGLTTLGHDLVYFDTSPARREQLAGDGHCVAAAMDEAADCDVYMLCVPTLPDDQGFDLAHIRAAVADVSRVLTPRRRAVVAVRSTLLPGTMRNVVLPLVERCTSMSVGQGFGLCYNPEFLRAASALDDLLHPPITVVGEFDAASAELIAQMYEPLGAPVLRTTPENAEAIKCFSNVYNATKVSFFNLLYLVGQRSGFDSATVAEGMQRASLGLRVPSYYTEGGYPYGGECLPKDLAACLSFLRRLELPQQLLQAVRDVNDEIARKSADAGSGGAGHQGRHSTPAG